MKIEIGEKSKEKSFSIFKKKISFFFRYIKNGCNILSKKKKRKKLEQKSMRKHQYVREQYIMYFIKNELNMRVTSIETFLKKKKKASICS